MEGEGPGEKPSALQSGRPSRVPGYGADSRSAAAVKGPVTSHDEGKDAGVSNC